MFYYASRCVVCILFVVKLVAYLAVSCHMTLVHELGSVAAVIVGNARKALTIVLSFILFPKPFSIFYVFGVILVFGSVVANVMLKEQRKSPQKQHRERADVRNDDDMNKTNRRSEEYP
jgi:solute carrier family 35 (adenosine 3'-phospho 5'-phosphosulfate transporter), member B3